MDESSRRRFLRRSLVVGGALAAGCLDAAAPATDTDSTSRPGGGTRVPTTPPGTTPGTSTEPGPDAQRPTESPTDSSSRDLPDAVSWSVDRGSPLSTAPVVDGGAVYAGTRDGAVSRHASEDGAASWTHRTDAPIQDIAVADDAVLAVSGTTELAAGHALVALDPASGERLWRFSPTDWWLELLATREGRVYVGTADDVLGQRDETLYAVPLASGEPAWEATVGDPREAVFAEDAVYVSTTGRLSAFDTAEGTELWQAGTPDPTFTTLAAVDGTVVQGFQPDDAGVYGLLAGFDASTGEERWRLDDWTVTSVATRGGDLYVGGAAVAGVDPTDGTTRWKSEVSGFVTEGAVGDERVYAGGDTLRSLDRKSGGVAWTWTPDPAQGGVQAAGLGGGVLHLDAYHDAEPRNQYKFAVDADTGDGVWTFEDGAELTDIVLGDDVAVVGCESGRLYGFDVPGE
jgi:outer membrane protein assembly factor BamB